MSRPRPPASPAEPNPALSQLTAALVWLTVVGAAVVFVEPAPFDILALLAILAAAAAGLSMPRDIAPFVLLLVLFCAGGYLGLALAEEPRKAFVWVSITLFLAVAGIFFATYVRGAPEARVRLILNAYLLAAVLVSALAILGYFGRIGPFLLYGRATATFKDPNVLGSFLALPGAYVIMLGLERPLSRAFWPLLGYAAIALAVLLTFSRGAWGLLAFSSLATGYLAFVTSRSSGRRARIALLGLLGCVLIAAGLLAILSFDSVEALFRSRATLAQSYDSQHLGRFERQILGALLALERPLGVGPHEFAKLFPEDTHNVYLNGFMSYGWLGGLAYASLVLWTLAKGLRLAFASSPRMRLYAIPIAATFLGMALEGAVIDTDHWRHFYLLAGLIWGLSVPRRPFRPGERSAVPSRALRPAPVEA